MRRKHFALEEGDHQGLRPLDLARNSRRAERTF
jgi:hypothetical protein